MTGVARTHVHCSEWMDRALDPTTGLYTDRWLWEEILGEDLSGPPVPPSNEPLVDAWDPNEPFIEDLPDDPAD